MNNSSLRENLKSTAACLLKKLLACVIFVAICTILAGAYGALNDQVTYSISPEYYTELKFEQFKLDREIVESAPRLAAAIVGIKATWWMGAILSAILALFGLMQDGCKRMLETLTKAALIVLFFAMALSASAFFSSTSSETSRSAEEGFALVKHMHNRAYEGGSIGAIAAILYLIVARNFDDAKRTSSKQEILK